MRHFVTFDRPATAGKQVIEGRVRWTLVDIASVAVGARQEVTDVRLGRVGRLGASSGHRTTASVRVRRGTDAERAVQRRRGLQRWHASGGGGSASCFG